ncbi:YicC/YloC family endoribonuclease [Tropicimonas sp.]|uniref:YicC/YloC family endoribonuclease n=1 Tax=Tropicimonas sp. TaxID=2067044 RepID=UPI003A88B938
MVNSMTGFAARTGQGVGHAWTWDIRGLNARGLDVRLRVPDWIDGLEPALRARLGAELKRGSVSLSLRLVRDEETAGPGIDPAALDQVLAALDQVMVRARARGVEMGAPDPTQIVAMKAVAAPGAETADAAALRELLLADFATVLADFQQMRASEGAAIGQVLTGQLDTIETLVAAAAQRLDGRADKAREALREALARVLENAEGFDEARLTQELALIAVKSDVTEELDRLRAHVAAARALLAEEGPVGRKLDFLTQEFNREANTLCSKSQDVALTRVGLDLKAAIDQMREQVQNVE